MTKAAHTMLMSHKSKRDDVLITRVVGESDIYGDEPTVEVVKSTKGVYRLQWQTGPDGYGIRDCTIYERFLNSVQVKRAICAIRCDRIIDKSRPDYNRVFIALWDILHEVLYGTDSPSNPMQFDVYGRLTASPR